MDETSSALWSKLTEDIIHGTNIGQPNQIVKIVRQQSANQTLTA